MGVIHSTTDDFDQNVLKRKGVVLVDFYADWCGPCRMTAPIIEELAKEMERVTFVKVNVDENPQLAQRYGIFSIPTFLIFKNGEKVGEFVGFRDKNGFQSELSNYLD